MWFNYNMKLEKRMSLLFIPLIFSGILSSCALINETKVLIPLVTTSDIKKETYTLPMTKERFLAFKEGKRSFILLSSSEKCHYCQELEPLLVNYVKEFKIEIYKLEGTSNEVADNLQFYTDELEPDGSLRTPTIYIFENGSIVKRELGTGKLKTRKEVITFFDQNIKFLNYYSLHDDTAINTTKEAIYFKFNFDSEFNQSLVNNNFYPLFSKKTTVYLIDEKARTNLEISFTKHEEVFTFNEENSDLTAALSFFKTNFS